MDKGRTRRNGPEEKKIVDDAQGLMPERWHRLYVPKKEKELTNIEDFVDLSNLGIYKKEQREIYCSNL